MQSHALPHVHLPHPHIDLSRLARDAVIASLLGFTATAVTASERTLRPNVAGSETAVSQEAASDVNVALGVEVRVGSLGALAIVRGLDPSAANAVSLVNEQGESVVPRLATEFGFRFANVPAGSYRVVASSEGPITNVNGAVISSAIVVRSEPFALYASGLVVIESR